MLEADDHEESTTSEPRKDQPKTDLIPAGEAYILPFGRPTWQLVMQLRSCDECSINHSDVAFLLLHVSSS